MCYIHTYCNTFFCIFFLYFFVVLVVLLFLFQLNATQLNSTHHVYIPSKCMIIHILCSYTIYVHIHIILNHYMSSIYVFMVYVLRHTLYICFGRVVGTGGSVRGCQIIFYCYFYLKYGLVWSAGYHTICFCNAGPGHAKQNISYMQCWLHCLQF